MAEHQSKNQAPPPALQQSDNAIIVHDESDFANLLDTAKFNHLWRVAMIFSRSQLVPAHFQGKPDNCFVATQMALRLGVDPMMFMQKSYIVHGRPGIEGQLIIALVNTRGPFVGPIQWRFEGTGDARSCTAYAVHKITGEECSVTIDMKLVKAEGWYGKEGSKWRTMPDQMFRYRTASWLAKAYCPEVTLGLSSIEELQDAGTVDMKQQPGGSYAEDVPSEDETWFQNMLNQLAEACPATAPEPPDMGALTEFTTVTARANNLTRTALLADALESPEGFFNAFFAWQVKMAGGNGGPKVLREELAARTEKIDPKTGEVIGELFQGQQPAAGA